MNLETWSSFLIGAKDGIKARMGECGLSPEQLAPLANLGERTIKRFVEGLTFEPRLRTALSCSEALGGDMEAWEREMFVDRAKRPAKARTVRSLRSHMKREGFTGTVIDKKNKGIAICHENGSFMVKGKPDKYPLDEWVKFAMKIQKNGKTCANVSVTV